MKYATIRYFGCGISDCFLFCSPLNRSDNLETGQGQDNMLVSLFACLFVYLFVVFVCLFLWKTTALGFVQSTC